MPAKLQDQAPSASRDWRPYRVITVDRDDFRIYRRNKREVIPLICPETR